MIDVTASVADPMFSIVSGKLEVAPRTTSPKSSVEGAEILGWTRTVPRTSTKKETLPDVVSTMSKR